MINFSIVRIWIKRCIRPRPMETASGWNVGTTFSTFLLMCVACFAPLAHAKEGRLHVGWATRSITPEIPVALAGQRHLRIAHKVLDPVTCTALAIETRDGDSTIDQAILVSCDLVSIRGGLQERLRSSLKSKLPDFDESKLFLNATHTHTAPVSYEGAYDIPTEGVIQTAEYVQLFVEQAQQAVLEAWTGRQPAGMSWALAHAAIGYNRRAVYADGKAIMYGSTQGDTFRQMEGYEDHGVELLFFWKSKTTPPANRSQDDSKRLLSGIVVNIACPSQETEGLSEVSADFWHEVRQELKKRYGKDLFVLPQCAAAGDLSPHLMFRKQAEQIMLERKGISRRQEIANRLARAIDEVLPYAQKARTHLDFRHRVDTVALPRRQATPEEYQQAKTKLKELTGRITGPSWEKVQQRRIIHSFENRDEYATYDMELHVLRLGDIALASNPFEYYVDFGIRIKARSPAVLTMIVQLAGPGTYVPTIRASAGGGYSAEIGSNLVGAEGGQVLVDETIKQIQRLWESD